MLIGLSRFSWSALVRYHSIYVVCTPHAVYARPFASAHKLSTIIFRINSNKKWLLYFVYYVVNGGCRCGLFAPLRVTTPNQCYVPMLKMWSERKKKKKERPTDVRTAPQKILFASANGKVFDFIFFFRIDQDSGSFVSGFCISCNNNYWAIIKFFFFLRSDSVYVLWKRLVNEKNTENYLIFFDNKIPLSQEAKSWRDRERKEKKRVFLLVDCMDFGFISSSRK